MPRIGDIEFEWVGPRYVRSRSVGELQNDETTEFMDHVAEQIGDAPYWLWEVNVAELTGINPAARRTVADRLWVLPDRAIAVVGAGFAQRTLGKFIFKAVAMLDKNKDRRRLEEFFPDSESAQAWLNACARDFEAEVDAV